MRAPGRASAGPRVTPPQRRSGSRAQLGAGGLSAWVLVEEEGTRGFVQGAGFDPDGAFRDRVVSADGDTLREVRLSCTLAEADDP